MTRNVRTDHLSFETPTAIANVVPFSRTDVNANRAISTFWKRPKIIRKSCSGNWFCDARCIRYRLTLIAEKKAYFVKVRLCQLLASESDSVVIPKWVMAAATLVVTKVVERATILKP